MNDFNFTEKKMNILIIGANGKVGQLLIKHLINDGYSVRAMVRQQEQTDNIKSLGAEAFLGDLENDFSAAYNNIDVVVFTAGSGSHTGPEKTIDIDQNAAMKSIDIAKDKQIKLFIMVSAQGARAPEAPSKIQHYFMAKSVADQYLLKSGLSYIIFRPGRLTDEPANNKSRINQHIESKGTTSRENLAYAISKSITIKETFNKTIEILDGPSSIVDGLKSIV